MNLKRINIMLRASTIKKLNTVFSNYPEIEAVYLFGSAALEGNAKYNDIDVGIVYSDAAITRKKIELYTRLVKQGFDDVDIVFFNTADLVLRFEIIHHNKLIYKKKGFDHGELFSITIRKYFDFEPYLEVQRRAIKKRILNG
jgi:predicted nucleotidyltransferase